MKKHFFGLAPHFSKIELLPVVLGFSSCSKHCSKLLIESHYFEAKKKLFWPSEPFFHKSWTFAGCSRLFLFWELSWLVLSLFYIVSKYKIKPRPVKRKKKHFFGPAPHFSKIELLPVVLSCSSCSKHCSKLSIESHYCKKKKMLFWPGEPFFHKNWTFAGCSRLFYLFWELFWIVLGLFYIVQKY